MRRQRSRWSTSNSHTQRVETVHDHDEDENNEDQLTVVADLKHGHGEQSQELFCENQLRWTGRKHGDKATVDARPDAETNKLMDICDHGTHVILPLHWLPLALSFHIYFCYTLRNTAWNTWVSRPTTIRPLSVWMFLSRSQSEAGTLGIQHSSPWDHLCIMYA